MSLKTATVIKKNQLTKDIFEIIITPSKEFNFIAGQFITIKIEDKLPPCFRAYSICSSPKNKEILLCIKKIPKGRGSNWLFNLKIEDEINFLGPNGNFTFKNKKRNTFFIATGTGIAPFYSIIEDELLKGNKNKIYLLFGLKNEESIFYKTHFENLANQYKNFDFNLTLSQPKTDSWEGKTGRVTNLLKNISFDVDRTDFYICGLKDMIDSVKNLLIKKGISEKSIYFEEY